MCSRNTVHENPKCTSEYPKAPTGISTSKIFSTSVPQSRLKDASKNLAIIEMCVDRTSWAMPGILSSGTTFRRSRYRIANTSPCGSKLTHYLKML